MTMVKIKFILLNYATHDLAIVKALLPSKESESERESRQKVTAAGRSSLLVRNLQQTEIVAGGHLLLLLRVKMKKQ